jgi:hypothetical protein
MRVMPAIDRRLWLVFFSDGEQVSFWSQFLRPGWRHICAAAWYPEQERWVYVNPARDRTHIRVQRGEEFAARFTYLWGTSTAILEVATMGERQFCPAFFSCVGAIKGLLGLRSWALTPRGLYAALIHAGAKAVRCNESEPRADLAA